MSRRYVDFVTTGAARVAFSAEVGSLTIGASLASAFSTGESAVISREMTGECHPSGEPCRWRVTRLDASGVPYGHSARRTLAEVIDCAWADGFRIVSGVL